MTTAMKISQGERQVIDDELIVAARTDREALGRLYDAFYPRIFRYCMRRLFVRAVAEDITSDIFVSVATHIRTFSGSTSPQFTRWIYWIATNQVINAIFAVTKILW